jgi:hypothetical protein
VLFKLKIQGFSCFSYALFVEAPDFSEKLGKISKNG